MTQRKVVSVILVFCLFMIGVASFFLTFHHVHACEQKSGSTESLKQIMWDGKTIAYPIASGQVSSDFNSVDSAHQEPHNGTDFAAVGDAYAVVDGLVVASHFNTERGHLVAVAFKGPENKMYTYLYQHLAHKSELVIGTEVHAGQVVGQIGNSGHSFGIHLHAEVEYADMTNNTPKWRGTYPTNTAVMFDFVKFFHLPRHYTKHSQITDIVTQVQTENMGNFEKCVKNEYSELKGTTHEQQAWHFFIEQGFTKEGAAGVVGNLIVESGLNPTAGEVGGKGGGRGIAQWGQCGVASNGANAGCRWQMLEKWAQANQLNVQELGTQLRYLLKEMQDYKMLEYFKQTKVIYLPNQGPYGGGSVGYFTERFERPDVRYAHMERRYRCAKEVLAKFGNDRE